MVELEFTSERRSSSACFDSILTTATGDDRSTSGILSKNVGDFLFLAGRVEIPIQCRHIMNLSVYLLLTIVPHKWLNWLSLMPLSSLVRQSRARYSPTALMWRGYLLLYIRYRLQGRRLSQIKPTPFPDLPYNRFSYSIVYPFVPIPDLPDNCLPYKQYLLQ